MTELSIKQTVVRYFEEWRPTSLTYLGVSLMADWWAEEPAQMAAKVEQVVQQQKPTENINFSTPLKSESTRSTTSDNNLLNSSVNSFVLAQTPMPSAPPLENAPSTIPKLIKPLSHNLFDGGCRFVIVYLGFPLVGHASLYYNSSLSGIKILCAVAVFNTDREQSKRLMKSAFLHGSMAVTDFAIGHLSFFYGALYALTPTGVMKVQKVVFSQYETTVQHEGKEASPQLDLRPVYERIADIFINMTTGSFQEDKWYWRLWTKLRSWKTTAQEKK